ncbi:hypothetical protein PQX77_014945 [Marasmius sp. AFHP31]|nr:hypothetical protein PQX77_014945 [Marasmius sp. AFHP31]
MTDSTCPIPGNPDIAGVGVRAAVYAQACLALIVLTLVHYKDEQTQGLSPDFIVSWSARILRNFERGIFMVGFAAIISAIIETGTSYRLTSYHSLIILNIGFINFWIGTLLMIWWWKLDTSDMTWRSNFRTCSWHLLHSTLYGAFGIYFWIQKVPSAGPYITSPTTGDSCQPLTYFWVFQPISDTNPNLRMTFLMFYGVIVAGGAMTQFLFIYLAATFAASFPMIGFPLLVQLTLIATKVALRFIAACQSRLIPHVPMFQIPWLKEVLGYISAPLERVQQYLSIVRRLLNTATSHPTRFLDSTLWDASYTLTICASPVIFAIISTEFTVQINSANVTARENDWTYGQTLALLTALVAIAMQLKEWRNLMKEEREARSRENAFGIQEPPGDDIEMGKVNVAPVTEMLEEEALHRVVPQRRGSV